MYTVDLRTLSDEAPSSQRFSIRGFGTSFKVVEISGGVPCAKLNLLYVRQDSEVKG
jgi:hypothetical protein